MENPYLQTKVISRTVSSDLQLLAKSEGSSKDQPGVRITYGVTQILLSQEDALERALARKRISDVPGLVEHIFSRGDLAQKIAYVVQDIRLGSQTSTLWDTASHRWKYFLDEENTDLTRGAERAEQMATFVNKLTDRIYESYAHRFKTGPPRRNWTATSRMRGGGSKDQASPAKRKPQLVLTEAISSSTKSPIWEQVLATAAFAPSEKGHPRTITRLTYNAWMAVCNQDDRRFFIGISFAGSEVRVCVFDRAGMVSSQEFNFQKQPSQLVHLITGLVLAQREDIGFDPNVYVEVVSGRRFVMVASVTYEILETIFVSGALAGSGTVCWRARRTSEGGRDSKAEGVVIKNIWADEEGAMSEKDAMNLVGCVEGVVRALFKSKESMKGRR